MNSTKLPLEAVQRAAQRLAGVAHRTPILTSQSLDRWAGRTVFLKAEHLQRVGAFKFRGAQNAVAQLSDAAAAPGVVTHSSGNHAQALALAASLRGIPAHIVMPHNAPVPKIEAVRGYGANITFCEPIVSERERMMEELRAATGAQFIPPYDHPEIIAGQGTVGLEICQEIAPLDAIIAPVGGGGLLSGVALAAKALVPGIRVFGAEPLGADDAARSLAQGQRILQTAPNTIADGLLTSLGEHTWPIIRDQVDGILTVSEPEIVAAMRFVWERTKQLIEPSAAVAVAALRAADFESKTDIKRVCVVLSGGNTDLKKLPW